MRAIRGRVSRLWARFLRARDRARQERIAVYEQRRVDREARQEDGIVDRPWGSGGI